MKHHYPLLQRIFGPRITPNQMLDLEIRAIKEGWYDWLEQIMQLRRANRLWLLAFLRDGFITVKSIAEEDVYEDLDPFELD